MTPRLFVTGTDTGVGKTRVATALVAAWAAEGRRVAVMKPAETGCREVDGALLAEDAAALLAASGRPLDPGLVCPFRYAVPASPETAAALAHQSPPDVAEVVRACERLAVDADVVVIEGAGGLLVPVAPGVLMADLARALGATLLIVARTGLGTINHTLLTVEVARHRGLPVAGVVLNQVAPEPGPEAPHVADRIAEHAAVRILGTLPYQQQPADLATLARRALDLAALWDALTLTPAQNAPESLRIIDPPSPL